MRVVKFVKVRSCSAMIGCVYFIKNVMDLTYRILSKEGKDLIYNFKR